MEKRSWKLDRIESGIPRLDYILRGGLLRGGTYTVLGPPGVGKTIFATQLCFNFIKIRGGRCVYVTLLTESISRLVSHLRPQSFFDEKALPDSLYFVSGFPTLEQGGLDGLLEAIKGMLKAHRADILVLDSVEAVSPSGVNPEFKRFLHHLQAYAALMRCTTLLLSLRSTEIARYENAMADGIIELSYRMEGPRAVRELTVLKFRGSGFLPGKHEVEISDHGLQIHPRTEIQFDNPAGDAPEQRERMAFGVRRLDEMMRGGPLTGSATALIGSPGTGKTMLGLSFLVEGARRGHRGIYFGFYEPPPRIIEKAEKIGLELQRYVDEGLIDILWQPPLEHHLDSLAERLLEKVKRERRDDRRRLFVDGIEGFRAATVYPDRIPRFLSAFFNQLRTSDVTTMIAEELGIFAPEGNIPSPELISVVESVIVLRYVEIRSQLYRLLSVMKMRESDFDPALREFKILDSGIEVAGSFESAEAILTGHARLRSERRDAHA